MLFSWPLLLFLVSRFCLLAQSLCLCINCSVQRCSSRLGTKMDTPTQYHAILIDASIQIHVCHAILQEVGTLTFSEKGTKVQKLSIPSARPLKKSRRMFHTGQCVPRKMTQPALASNIYDIFPFFNFATFQANRVALSDVKVGTYQQQIL